MTRRRAFALGAALCVAVAALGVLWLRAEFRNPYRPGSGPKIVELPRGTGLRAISARLEEQGIIRTRYTFSLLTWLLGQARNLQAGEYLLSAAMPPAAILERMVRGEVVQHPLIIPEGYTTWEIAAAAERAGIASAEKIRALSRDREFLLALNVPGASTEGYLFPETYHFPKETPAKKILGRMVSTFWKRFLPEMVRQAAKRNLSIHEVVTLASIIEREAALPRERPQISAVYQNRLRRGMRLQADPTVLYALNRTSGPLSREDLEVDSPYNTYRVRGFPPGPIANPGLDSLLAVLNPAPVDHLYFVARGDGSHEFSRTLAEHQKAVWKYRKRPGPSSNSPPPNPP